jgi:uncharacterized protein (TIGR02270 family)
MAARTGVAAPIALAVVGRSAAASRPKVVARIVDEHADGAAAVWLRRDQAVASLDYTLRELAELDDRLDAHLQGLRCAGGAGWHACDRLLAEADAGELFAPTVLALEARDVDRVAQLLAIAEGVPELARSALSAFGWVAPRFLQGIVAQCLAGRSSFVRRIGLASCAQHRVPSDAALRAAGADDVAAVRARAWRAAGEIGAGLLRPQLLAALDRGEADESFEAAWALVLLGDQGDGLDRLAAFSLERGPRQLRALQTVLAVLGVDDARALLRQLADATPDPRMLMMAVGLSGDVHYVPWLIAQMAEPMVAPLAGEAFSMITGAALARENLTRKPGAVVDEDATAAATPAADRPPLFVGEAALARPDAGKVQAWWVARHDLHLPAGTLLHGRPRDAAACHDVLRQGCQQRRIAAALRLRLLAPRQPLFDCRAPAWLNAA